jgi:uncharacterized protein
VRRLLADTNVFLYALGTEHPLRAPARALIDAAGAGRLSITTTPLVVQEIVHVRAVRRDRSDAVAVAHDVVRMCDPLLIESAGDLSRALELFVRYDRLDPFDSLLAATALNADVDGLVSADRAYAGVRGLSWIDLATLSLTDHEQ